VGSGIAEVQMHDKFERCLVISNCSYVVLVILSC